MRCEGYYPLASAPDFFSPPFIWKNIKAKNLLVVYDRQQFVRCAAVTRGHVAEEDSGFARVRRRTRIGAWVGAS